MSKEIRCFFVVPTERCTRKLRRYHRDSTSVKCEASGWGYHNASAPIEDAVERRTPEGYVESISPLEFRGDPRWPARCACGYTFEADDHWQVFTDTIYRNEATGEEWPMRSLPPGAMYDAWWYRDKDGTGRAGEKVGPDGLCLCVCLPPGGGLDYWHVDGPANNGPGWTRSGTVPNITANPSILTPRYHGWLRDGVLVEC